MNYLGGGSREKHRPPPPHPFLPSSFIFCGCKFALKVSRDEELRKGGSSGSAAKSVDERGIKGRRRSPRAGVVLRFRRPKTIRGEAAASHVAKSAAIIFDLASLN